ncbi:PAC2 family protein [Chloroflexota bacterium]
MPIKRDRSIDTPDYEQDKMRNLVKLYARPRLRAPNMVAAWPGISNVSIIAATYLLKVLDFKELGEIEPSYFFDPIGVSVKDNVVEAPQFPRSRFYYWKNKGGNSDIILFIGDDQPSAKGYELVNCVLDVALRFRVKRIYTCAAALTRIHHTEQPRVWGVGTRQEVVDELQRYELLRKGNLQIAGLNGLLLGAAQERGMECACLLGEVPMYTSRIQNPMAALAVLEVLAKLLQVEIDTTELSLIALEANERMKEIAAEAMGEYIDYFTRPIWESGQEEEEEEDN